MFREFQRVLRPGGALILDTAIEMAAWCCMVVERLADDALYLEALTIDWT